MWHGLMDFHDFTFFYFFFTEACFFTVNVEYGVLHNGSSFSKDDRVKGADSP